MPRHNSGLKSCRVNTVAVTCTDNRANVGTRASCRTLALTTDPHSSRTNIETAAICRTAAPTVAPPGQCTVPVPKPKLSHKPCREGCCDVCRTVTGAATKGIAVPALMRTLQPCVSPNQGSSRTETHTATATDAVLLVVVDWRGLPDSGCSLGLLPVGETRNVHLFHARIDVLRGNRLEALDDILAGPAGDDIVNAPM